MPQVGIQIESKFQSYQTDSRRIQHLENVLKTTDVQLFQVKTHL